jgi:hypothetical protein
MGGGHAASTWGAFIAGTALGPQGEQARQHQSTIYGHRAGWRGTDVRDLSWAWPTPRVSLISR